MADEHTDVDVNATDEDVDVKIISFEELLGKLGE